MRRRSAGQHAFSRESGQGLFLLLALLLFVGAGLIFSLARPAPPNIKNDKQTAAALAQAKAALIGYAAADSNRPGELPCPDVDNDGASTPISDYAGSNCVNLVGRLPWKTLGLPDLRDGGGERLWYVLSNDFHAGAAPPLNSDTMGQLTVTGGAPATNVVAIVFSPGEVLDTQARDPANENNVANYLEGENANGDTIFMTGASSATFNDRLLVITNADLMPVVEQRVAREVISILQSYKTATAALGYNGGAGVYPWADISDGNSNTGLNRGRFPCNSADPEDWGPPMPTLPNWLTNGCPLSGWSAVIYYTAAQNRLDAGCSTCTAATLSVNGVAGTELVLLTPGAAGASPRGAWPTAYFEDSENNDNANDSYVTPSSTAYDRDRLFKFP
jgi:hypothetical protein